MIDSKCRDLILSRRELLGISAGVLSCLMIPNIALAESTEESNIDEGIVIAEGTIVLLDDYPDTRASVVGNAGRASLVWLPSAWELHWNIDLNSAAPAMSFRGEISVRSNGSSVDYTDISGSFGARSWSGSWSPMNLYPGKSHTATMGGNGYDIIGRPIAQVVAGLNQSFVPR